MSKYRLLAAVYIVLLFFTFLFVFASVDESAPHDTMVAGSMVTAPPPAPTATPMPTSTPTPTPIPVANPVRIIIPRLNVNTAIESKGHDAEGHMDVPSDWRNVSWFNLGPRPGEPGAAVIAGHYDTGYGTPAVFYHLSALQPGDEIQVIDETDQARIFKVTGIRNYNYEYVPVEQVFNDTSGFKLNLITCSGYWDFATGNYTDRLVVYSELQ